MAPKPQSSFDKALNGPRPLRGSQNDLDLEAIEREYRSGRLTIVEIGRYYGTSKSYINELANKFGWERNLSRKIAEETAAQLAVDVDSNLTVDGEKSTIALAAARSVQIVREHRSLIGKNKEIVDTLFSQLKEAVGNREDYEELVKELERGSSGTRRELMLKAVRLPAHAQTAGTLATTLRILIGLDRQAFNIAADNLPSTRPAGGITDDMSPAEAAAAYAATLQAP